ncbi:DoxX family membrane protein [Leptobacterium flavescens]|uniref:DoxX family membrane protein n=1 Tax=Leptobacterium flavescens TaxID=472055 RepID=A0A6P0UR80_9FLAO|nr:DoxX family membrane protein [Leptobacterium flavescens]NER14269.1 DoxX family membrane protein [Leptobacterium flavescens]
MSSKLTLVARILLGLILVVFGANKFYEFLPALPLDENGGAYAFFGALAATGYMIYLIGLVEVIAGILLLTNRSVPFALVILAPISVNVVLFHALLDPSNIAPALLVALLNIYLISRNWGAYKSLF